MGKRLAVFCLGKPFGVSGNRKVVFADYEPGEDFDVVGVGLLDKSFYKEVLAKTVKFSQLTLVIGQAVAPGRKVYGVDVGPLRSP